MTDSDTGPDTIKQNEISRKRAFIINFLYYAIVLAVIFVVIKYGLSILAPFVVAFLIAWLLQKPIHFLSEKLHIGRKLAGILMVLVFYSTIGLFLSIASIRAFAASKEFVLNLPTIYSHYLEPGIMNIFGSLEQLAMRMDQSILVALEEMFYQFTQSLGQMVSSLSMGAMSSISGLASSLPALFIKLLLMIISTFFITADYEQLTAFFLRQLNPKTEALFIQVKEYVVGTLFVCIRSYALIMSITFIELAICLTIIGVPNSIPIALLISIFDILPVLGTGGIMIPWTLITALQGNYTLAFGLLASYLIVTVIRNILEPKIVGSQIGLHPVATLASMFVGSHFFGILGLFGFPILLSLLRHLNDKGVIKILKNPIDNK